MSTIAVPMIDQASFTLAPGGMATGVRTPLGVAAAEVAAAAPTGLPFEGAHAFRESTRARTKKNVITNGGTAAGMSDEEERNERRERNRYRKDREGPPVLGSASFEMFTSLV